MNPKPPHKREVKIDFVDRTLFLPDSMQHEVDSQRAVDGYLQEHIFSGRLYSRDYRD